MELLGILLLILPGFTMGQQCNIPGDCKGFSLDTEIVNSQRDCLKHCNSFEKCEWYTYDSRDGFCNVLEDCPEVDSGCDTCISGEDECEHPLICFVQGDCSGAYIDHIDVGSAEECLDHCFNDYPDCQYFSFYTESLVCNFYETCVLDDKETDVVSGERDCYQQVSASTKIFVQEYRDTAWIHMPSYHESGDGTICSQTPEYPLFTYGVVGHVINGSITMCGGDPDITDCFSLDAAINVWVEFPSMNVVRDSAKSVMTPAGWWLTGGYNIMHLDTSSLWNGTAWGPGPDLPSARAGHCLAEVNSTHTFMAGGYDSFDFLWDAYLYNWASDSWTELPDMNAGLSTLACTLYQDSQGGQFVMTAGGVGHDRWVVQSLDLGNPVDWTNLPNLPTDVEDGEFVQDGDDLILVNPHMGNVLRFDKNSLMFDEIEGLTLPVGSYYVAVMAIDDSTLNGCS